MIKIFDILSQKKQIEHQINKNISQVLNHGKFIQGPEVKKLEFELLNYTGSKHCITCANGTDAIKIAMMALGVGAGDEVIIPGFSYISTVEVIKLLGAKPVYVDISLKDFNIDVNKIEEQITERTKAIIPTSLFGQCPDFNKINLIAHNYSLHVIEDAAQSCGAVQNGKKSCNLSEISTTSFFPTKPLGCYGDGGALFTSNDELANLINIISKHGQNKKYFHEKVGINSRLDSIQAAILLAKLSILDKEIEKRNKNAKLLNSLLSKSTRIVVPRVLNNNKSAWANYTVITDLRNEIKEKLAKAKIETNIYYPLPLYKQIAYNDDKIKLKNVELAANSVLSLPINAYLSKDQIEEIGYIIIKILNG